MRSLPDAFSRKPWYTVPRLLETQMRLRLLRDIECDPADRQAEEVAVKSHFSLRAHHALKAHHRRAESVAVLARAPAQLGATGRPQENPEQSSIPRVSGDARL